MSFDAKALFTSIPLQLALDCTENAIKNSTVELPLPTDDIRDLKIPWTRRLRERREPGARTPPTSREKQIKIEQVGLSACLTRENKVMLSCFNSMTSFRKTREVLLD